MATHVSPSDAYAYLHYAKDQNFINSFTKLRQDNRILWKIEVPSTNYDNYHGIKWAEIVLTSREVCAFMEGIYAGTDMHPIHRPGARI